MRINGASNPPGTTSTPQPMIFTKLSQGALAANLLVKIGSDQNHVVAATLGADVIGVTVSAAAGAGEPVRIATLSGAVTLTASATVNAGQLLEGGASGKVGPMGSGVGDHVGCGVALTNAAADGDTFTASGALFIKTI